MQIYTYSCVYVKLSLPSTVSTKRVNARKKVGQILVMTKQPEHFFKINFQISISSCR